MTSADYGRKVAGLMIGLRRPDRDDFLTYWRWVVSREASESVESLERVADARVTAQWIVGAVAFAHDEGMLRESDFVRRTAAAYHEFRRLGIAEPVGDQDLPYELLSAARKADLLELVKHAVELTGHRR